MDCGSLCEKQGIAGLRCMDLQGAPGSPGLCGITRQVTLTDGLTSQTKDTALL